MFPFIAIYSPHIHDLQFSATVSADSYLGLTNKP